ncbi:MAG: hypothetical protein ABFR36_02220 [Acidobacteriota bacterium]
MDYEKGIPEKNILQTSKIKSRVLLYTAVFFVAYSIYTFDSFSSWKFLAVIIPLGFSFISYRGKWIFLPVLVIIWFAFMVMSVGVIYNHDILEITGPVVCPDGYKAEVRVRTLNPVPGETYTQARMTCVNDAGHRIDPGWKPHFTVLGLYLIPALLLFFINIIFLRLGRVFIKNPYALYLSGSVLFIFLARLIWINRDQIISYVKTVF